MEATDAPKPTEEAVNPAAVERELVDIWGKKVGFHYSADSGLDGILEHGLLSRMEEQKRGLKVRIGASRSSPDTVYFTTKPQELYMRIRTLEDEEKTLNEKARELVAIIVDRPSYAYKEEGHFGIQDAVPPEDIKGLVFIDREVARTTTEEFKKSHDDYKFEGVLSWDARQRRVKALKEISEKAGIKNMPIYGISGHLYSPQELTHDTIIRFASQGKKI